MPDIVVTDREVSKGIQYFGTSFINPMGEDDREGVFELFMRKMRVNMVRVIIHTDSIRPGHVHQDMERIPYEEPQRTEVGWWHSKVSRANDIDSLLRMRIVPYINVWDSEGELEGQPNKIEDYARDLAVFCERAWPSSRTWYWAYLNEPFLHGYSAEEYIREFKAWEKGLHRGLGGGGNLIAPDVQSNKIRGSQMTDVLQEIGHQLSGVSIHGLYNLGQNERIWHFDNVKHLQGHRVFHTEWFPRQEDMDRWGAAISVAKCYHYQTQSGTFASLMFYLFESLFWNRRSDWGHTYGAIRIDNRDFTVDRPTKTFYVLKRMHRFLRKGPIVTVEGPESLLMSARRRIRNATLVVINPNSSSQTCEVDMGREQGEPLRVYRSSNRDHDVLIERTVYTRPFNIEFLGDSVTSIVVGRIGGAHIISS